MSYKNKKLKNILGKINLTNQWVTSMAFISYTINKDTISI